MSKYFEHLLDEYPILPYLDDKDSLVRWVWFIHNKINDKLEKPTMTLEQFYVSYYDKYKPKQVTFMENNKLLKRVIFICILISLLYAINFLYNDIL